MAEVASSDWKDALHGLKGTITRDRPLADLSWLRVGGAAEILFQPADAGDLQAFLGQLPADVPVMPIGVCSNLIIRDGGIPGAVVRLGRGFNGFAVTPEGHIRVGAAALDQQVARQAAAAGYDLAFLRTIPGAIGGAVRMNAGCYGDYLADVFVSARAVRRDGALVTLRPGDMRFAYRHTALPDDLVIVEADLAPPRAEPAAIEAKMQAALMRRGASQPVRERSCGSTFRNPSGHSSTGEAGDSHELKAWKVIDDAGLRGARLGGAQMSEMHPNFLINTGGASARDLEDLGELVRKKVFQHSGISLEWEIRRVGEPAP